MTDTFNTRPTRLDEMGPYGNGDAEVGHTIGHTTAPSAPMGYSLTELLDRLNGFHGEFVDFVIQLRNQNDLLGGVIPSTSLDASPEKPKFNGYLEAGHMLVSELKDLLAQAQEEVQRHSRLLG